MKDKRLDRDFQVWEFKKTGEDRGTVRGLNDTELVVTKEIALTDFPLDEITFFVENGVILLPMEH